MPYEQGCSNFSKQKLPQVPENYSTGHLIWARILSHNGTSHIILSSEGNVLSYPASLSKGGAQKEQNWEIKKKSSLGKAMLLPRQFNKQLSSSGFHFIARMLKTTSKDNKINSTKRIMKYNTKKIPNVWDDTEHSVLRARITTFLPKKLMLGISTVKTNTGLESPFRRCLPSLPNSQNYNTLHILVPIEVPFKLLNKVCTKHWSIKQCCDFQSSLKESVESLPCALHCNISDLHLPRLSTALFCTPLLLDQCIHMLLLFEKSACQWVQVTLTWSLPRNSVPLCWRLATFPLTQLC